MPRHDDSSRRSLSSTWAELRTAAPILFPALFLFVLPFAHVTALRSIGFGGALLLALWVGLRGRHRPLPLKGPFIFWLLAAVASIATTVDMRMTLGEIRTDVLYSIATFYSFFILTRDDADLQRWRSITAASLAFLGLIAIVSYGYLGYWGDSYQNFIGEYSTAVITAIPLLVTIFLDQRSGKSRLRVWSSAGAVALALVGGLLAKSRAFWVVIGAVMLCASGLYAAKDWPRRRKSLSVALAIATLAGAAGLYVSRERDINFDRFSDRAAIYTFVAKNFLQHPLYGTGFGRETNRDAYRKYISNKAVHHEIRHAHQLLLSYLEQMGVWGAIALFWLFGALAVRFWRTWRSPQPELATVGAAGLTLLVAVGLKNSTDMFFTGQLLLLFWAHAGILLGAAAGANYSKDART